MGFGTFGNQICSLDSSWLGSDPYQRNDEQCLIRAVDPLNDDELLELLSNYEIIEPLPAVGSGTLESSSPPSAVAPPTESPESETDDTELTQPAVQGEEVESADPLC